MNKHQLTSEELDYLIFIELHTGHISLFTNVILDYFYKNNIKSFYNYARCASRDMNVKLISKPIWFDYMIYTINAKTSRLSENQKLIPSV